LSPYEAFIAHKDMNVHPFSIVKELLKFRAYCHYVHYSCLDRQLFNA
jgi:hypothetical protein